MKKSSEARICKLLKTYNRLIVVGKKEIQNNDAKINKCLILLKNKHKKIDVYA